MLYFQNCLKYIHAKEKIFFITKLTDVNKTEHLFGLPKIAFGLKINANAWCNVVHIIFPAKVDHVPQNMDHVPQDRGSCSAKDGSCSWLMFPGNVDHVPREHGSCSAGSWIMFRGLMGHDGALMQSHHDLTELFCTHTLQMEVCTAVCVCH